MKIISNKRFQIFLLLFIFLLSLRIDYRFDTSIKCCSDEYDYFSHASTIVYDFDLDYSNQNIRDFSYYRNDKNTPIGFIGTGILLSPFLFTGNLISEIINENPATEILNFQFLIYSFASIFYFFVSYFLIINSLSHLKIQFNNFHLLLIFSGSGLSYYAFERFGMTHVFEVFCLSLLINISIKYYSKGNVENKLIAFFIPFTLLIGFITRMSNFYIFIVPYLIKKIVQHRNLLNKHNLFLKKEFILSSVLVGTIYYLLSIELYGELIFNPQKIYGTSINATDILQSQNNLLSLLASVMKTLLLTLLSWEFGLFWVSPILFLGIVSIFYKTSRSSYLVNTGLLICFAQNLLIVHIWQALGSSYGFRYLFSLIPLSIIVYFVYLDKHLIIRRYLFTFSIFSNLSVFFFETTAMTQLSTIDVVNSFGKSIRYSAPEYVRGLLFSFFEVESYMIIFTTSFLGVLFFKLLSTFLSHESIIGLLEKAGLPAQNEDFLNYLDELSVIGGEKVIFTVLFLYLASYFIVNYKKYFTSQFTNKH